MTHHQFAAPFILWRDRDETGVSGTGPVADGVRFPDGTAVIHWRGELVSTTVFESVEVLEKIHGHNGATRILWAPSIERAVS